MPQRTTKKDLERFAKRLSEETGNDYSIGYAYGSPRLEENNGSRDVSPRKPAGQLYQWMLAFRLGVSAGKETKRKKEGFTQVQHAENWGQIK